MKKLIAIVLTLVLALSFAACAQPEAAPAETAAPETTESAAPSELVKVKVGASVTPHAEILNAVKDELKAAGYDLEVVEFTDYVLPTPHWSRGIWTPITSSIRRILKTSTRKTAPIW